MITDNDDLTVTLDRRAAGLRQSKKLGAIMSRLLAPFARRFIAGITLADALATAEALKAQGYRTTIDHLGESVVSAEEANRAALQYLIILRALKEKGLDRNVSVKLSQIGLELDSSLCVANLKKIAEAAEAIHGFVRVDMEGSNATSKTLDVVRAVKNNRSTPVGAVLQAMLKRTPIDLVGLLETEIGVRLCKGAYKEPEEIAFKDMREIRRQYLALAKRLITSGSYQAIATHDEYLVREIISFARSQKIASDKFEFQMLLGIERSLQKKIITDGWRLRIYVPFGRAWAPYTWRRIRERKENLWFVIKNLF